MARPSVSVLLSTFDGARHLDALLDSIDAQTRRPDLLIVRDDGSRDETRDVIERWRAGRPWVTVQTSGPRLGSARSFWGLLEGTDATFAAFADQDDVWHPDKLASQLEAIDAGHPEGDGAAACFHDAALLDAAGHRLPGRLWDRTWRDLATRGADRAALLAGELATQLLRRNVVTGATLLVRTQPVRTLVRQGLGPPPVGWHHDEWIALALAVAGHRLVALDRPLLDYRSHPGQQVGAGRQGIARLTGFDPRGHRVRVQCRAGGLDSLANLIPVPELIEAAADWGARADAVSRGVAGIGALIAGLGGEGSLSPAAYRRRAPDRFSRGRDIAAAWSARRARGTRQADRDAEDPADRNVPHSP
jgi:hypothetical protein